MKVQCPFCKGLETVKRGKRKHKNFLEQQYFCKLCNKTFVQNDDFKGSRQLPIHILEAVFLFSKGLDADSISEYLKKFSNINVSKSSVKTWHKKYSEVILEYVDNLSKLKNRYKSLNKSSLEIFVSNKTKLKK